MSGLDADTVAERLRDAATREQTLQALEGMEAADLALGLAAAPAIGDLLAMDAAQLGQRQFDRVNLLLARLLVDLSDDVIPLYTACFSDGRLQAAHGAQGALAQFLRKPAVELTVADAHTVACWQAHHAASQRRGWTELANAVGFTTKHWCSLFMTDASLFSKARMPDDDCVARLILLLAEGLRSGRISGLMAAGVPYAIREVFLARPGPQFGQLVLDAEIFRLLGAELRNGTPADWVVRLTHCTETWPRHLQSSSGRYIRH